MLTIKVVQGDIVREIVDAIVNAANTTLLGGGGVDGAIHGAAGPELLEECRSLGGCPTGQARMTSGYRLAARHVIHTVGPIWSGGVRGEADLLASCYVRCLSIAENARLSSIAFPAISTGIFGYPLIPSTRIAIATVRAHTGRHLREARFVCFDAETSAAYRQVLGESD